MPEQTETLAALLRRHHADDDPPDDIPRASLSEALRGGEDPLQLVAYLAGLGTQVRDLADLLRINDDPDEEELHAFRVQEGVAVSVASDGAWALYTA